MSIKFNVLKDNFSILDKLEKLSKQKENAVEVGFMQDFNSTYKTGQNVVEVAIWNEFGTEKSPPRPFMRRTAQRTLDELNRKRKAIIKLLIHEKVTLPEAMKLLGIFYRDKIKETINHEDFAPNKKSTIKKKGEGKRPLIDTHRMINSVNFKVVSTKK